MCTAPSVLWSRLGVNPPRTLQFLPQISPRKRRPGKRGDKTRDEDRGEEERRKRARAHPDPVLN